MKSVKNLLATPSPLQGASKLKYNAVMKKHRGIANGYSLKGKLIKKSYPIPQIESGRVLKNQNTALISNINDIANGRYVRLSKVLIQILVCRKRIPQGEKFLWPPTDSNLYGRMKCGRSKKNGLMKIEC